MSAAIELRRAMGLGAAVEARHGRMTDTEVALTDIVATTVTQIKITPEAIAAVKAAWPGAWDNEAENLIRAMSAHYGFEVLG